jgi:hypothetical protein
MSEDIYFAAMDGYKLASELEGRIKSWANTVESTGLRSKWESSYRMYYGKFYDDSYSFANSNIADMGETGELKGLAVNQYRNFIQHVMTMTTSQRPSWQCRAINSDLKSLQQAKLGNSVLDHYMISKRLLRQYKRAAEMSLVFGKGFVKTNWEKSSGRPYMMEQDVDGNIKVISEGDVEVRTLSPYDYVIDPAVEDFDSRQWELTRTMANKYDLAARYPQFKDAIIRTEGTSMRGDAPYKFWAFNDLIDGVTIPVYEFYHKRTDALPNGRFLLFVDSDIVLYDGPIPYKGLTVDRIVPGEIFGTTEGYTMGFDLLGLQEAYNSLISTVFTNQSAFGVQSVLIPRTANISVEQLSKSLAGIKYDPAGGEPKPLQLTASPPEVFTLLQLINQSMETVSGVNSVARGNIGPDSPLKSGVALALVQSMAVQFASGFQESWANLVEDGGTKIFDLLKTFAKTERIAEISGKFNKPRLLSFKGEDLEGVSRVVVELGNPMTRTTAGRVAMADALLEKGMVTTPQEYLQVMETGNLDPLIEGPLSQLDLIRAENELMMDGQVSKVRVLMTDNHILHAQEHKCILDNPLVRADDEIVAGVLAHIQEHLELYRSQDPIMASISGNPPPPPQPSPQDSSMMEQMPPPGMPQPPPELPANAALPPQEIGQPLPI